MRLVLLLALTALAGCATPEPPPPTEAERVIAEAIAANGGERYEASTVRFEFRGAAYTVARSPDGAWHVERSDSASTDRLDPSGVSRRAAGAPLALTPDQARSIETDLNSVAYFALLPYKLDDPAVQATVLPPDTIRGVPYDVVEVTFAREGGGRDWEDRFVYWFREDDRAMDYLAYRYYTGEGGTRFREALNARTVRGIRVADFRNFTADGDSALFGPIERYPDLLDTDSLRLVSDVVLERVRVE